MNNHFILFLLFCFTTVYSIIYYNNIIESINNISNETFFDKPQCNIMIICDILFYIGQSLN